MSIKYHTGNLFDTDVKSLAHCVSSCFNMGAGIARTFKERFGRQNELVATKSKIGSVVGFESDSQQTGNSIYIFYLVTKAKYYEKPLLSDLLASLRIMRDMMLIYEMTEVAMPKIGCGLDKLKWSDVENGIIDIFSNTNIIIHIYSLP